MYFPYFRGKQNELVALEELHNDISLSGKIIPIIEPVNTNNTTINKLSFYVEKGMPFAFITNPKVGPLKNDSATIYDSLYEPYLMECDTCHMALIHDQSTTLRDIENFTDTYQHHPLIFIYDSEPTNDDIIEELAANPKIEYHIFFNYKPKRKLSEKVPVSKRVIIKDQFAREERNADYQKCSPFSDDYLNKPNAQYHHFGDFSIVGKSFQESGGPAYAVALHHMYINREDSDMLWLCHFVSNETDSPRNPGGKFLDALKKLINEVPNLGEESITPVVKEYELLHSRQHYPGLGVAKRLGIKHHLNLMCNLL